PQRESCAFCRANTAPVIHRPCTTTMVRGARLSSGPRGHTRAADIEEDGSITEVRSPAIIASRARAMRHPVTWRMPLPLPVLALFLAPPVVVVSYVVLAIGGFGSALISIPLLALMLPVKLVIPAVLIVDFIATAASGL